MLMKCVADAGGTKMVPMTTDEEQAITADWNASELAQSAMLQTRLENAVQAHLDAKAMARGYSGILSAATYVTSEDPVFSAEGIGYRDFRDLAWRYCYQQLAAVQTGKRSVPTEAGLLSEIDANCPLVLP